MAGIDKNGQGQGPQAGPKETDGPESSANEGRAQDATDDAWAAMADRLPDEAAASLEDALIVDVDGFEGPLDFLLALARQQKLDLAKISILALAEQYLAFIERAKALRLELAADYLVMAAWLAYLKSRLLIPDLGADEEPSGEELAAILAFRLKKLEAMREAAGQLMDRPHLGKAFFLRGQPEDISLQRKPHFTASLYDLLTAYAAQRQRQSVSLVHVRKREVWSLQEARDVLVRLVGTVSDWMPVDELLRSYLKLGDVRSTALASSFAASLELVREGHLEIRQTEAFGTIYIRSPRGK